MNTEHILIMLLEYIESSRHIEILQARWGEELQFISHYQASIELQGLHKYTVCTSYIATASMVGQERTNTECEGSSTLPQKPCRKEKNGWFRNSNRVGL